ncbi:MAG: ATP-binding protein, partial [Candidatus Thermoplasmatota archaeon]|nr:ATP-binding protein [Candidatus Thermoplasmatota archaeon]
MFVNREKELMELSRFHERSRTGAQMVVLYGRRRIGKTSLVKEFLKGKRGIYLFIEPRSQELLFREAEELLSEVLGIRPQISSWDELFEICKKKDLILIMDEFQNLARIDRTILNRIQRIWDDLKEGPGLLFIAVGSYVGMIKRIFRDAKQPLFGRANGMMRLGALNIGPSMEILSNSGMDLSRGLRYYSVFGGVPRYLIEIEESRDIIEEMILGTSSFLREEGVNILTMEFGTQHKGYFSVLESVSRGKGTPLEISHNAGMSQATVSKYLGELEKEYELVKGERPVTVKNHKLVRYRIVDPFLSFWFRYVFSRASRLEIDPGRVLSDIENEMPQIVSKAMEKVAGELLIEDKDLISPTLMGRWWSRDGEEIDIVAVDEDMDEILFAEVKWRNRPVGVGVLEELIRRS